MMSSPNIPQVSNKSKSEKNIKRAKMIRWLRNIHGWLGLWGAVLGLLFGVTGFLLNHRNVMKIPAVQIEESEIHLPIAQPYPANKEAFVHLLQHEFSINHEPFAKKAKREFSRPHDVRFLGKTIKQPAKWEVEFRMPHRKLTAEYVVGNEFALVRNEAPNGWGFLVNMHKGTGASAGWVLMADTVAGALFVLSITGVLLWTKMRQSSLVLVSLVGASVIITLWLTLDMI